MTDVHFLEPPDEARQINAMLVLAEQEISRAFGIPPWVIRGGMSPESIKAIALWFTWLAMGKPDDFCGDVIRGE